MSSTSVSTTSSVSPRGCSMNQHRCAERGLEIGSQVVDVLDPDRQPHEPARHRERRLGDRGMGHRRRQLDQRLDRAERLGQREEAGCRREATRALLTVAQLEAQHRAGDAHLALDELGSRVVRQAGIVHALDLGALGEPQRQDQRVGRCALHAHRQRPEVAARGSSRTGSAPRRRRSGGSEAARRARRSGWRPGRSITSEWPPRYFVAEWSTRSAPRFSRRWM